MTAAAPNPEPGRALELVICRAGERDRIALVDRAITVGRRDDRDVIFIEPHVSRHHAHFERRGLAWYVVDDGSSHGTFVNGARITEQALTPGDRIDFGSRTDNHVLFCPVPVPVRPTVPGSGVLLTQLSGLSRRNDDASELEMLRMFVEAARTLNSTGAITDILNTLIDTALRLTRADRGFVFLRAENGGELRLAAGRDARGQVLSEAQRVSQSALRAASVAASEFILSGTADDAAAAAAHSIAAHDLRTVVAIPLRWSQFRQDTGQNGGGDVAGVLYLDSHLLTGKLSAVSHELLRTIAREAASLVENAYLAKAEQEAQSYQRELAIASAIQQSLMPARIPEIPFARIEAKSLSCKEVGGDFYDVIPLPSDAVAIIVADVSGKGVSAALLAAILQGLIYPMLLQNVPLRTISDVANRYLYQRVGGQKYATWFLARLNKYGTLEYTNCGHVAPVIVSSDGVSRPRDGNVPVGLLVPFEFSDALLTMKPGDHLTIVTDGIVEAEDATGEFFDDERLVAAAAQPGPIERLFTAVHKFRGATPLNDDCTALEITYLGSRQPTQH